MGLLSLTLALTTALPGLLPSMPPARSDSASGNTLSFLNAPAAGSPTPAAEPNPISPILSGDSTGNPFGSALSAPARRPFESDHAFDGFINPISNPVLAKDARSSTQA